MAKEPQRLTNEQFFSPSVGFGIFHQYLTGHIGIHWHEFYEISYYLSGSGHNVINGTSYPLAPGSLFFMTPADLHEIVVDECDPPELYNMIFTEDMLSEEMRDLLLNNGIPQLTWFEEDMEETAAAFRRIDKEAAVKGPGYRLVVRGALERILVEAMRRRPLAGATVRAQQPNIRRALAYIDHRFREPITLDDAARQAGLAPNYFSQRFRAAVGTTFQTYLQERRLEFARSLLSATDLPVTEICYASGFNTLTHFERAFKGRFGCSPRKGRSRQHYAD